MTEQSAPYHTNKTLLIGIDPGRSTGFAVKLKGSADFIALNTFTFWEAINALEKYYCDWINSGYIERIIVRLEYPDLNKPTFHKKVRGEKVRENISQKVGMNKRDAQLILQWLEERGVEVVCVQPSAYSGVNIDHYRFGLMTKWKGRTNQHERDAGMLIWGL